MSTPTQHLLARWVYRYLLLTATLLCLLLLTAVQASLTPHTHPLHNLALEDAQYLWLLPVPIAVFLWLGWFLFATATDNTAPASQAKDPRAVLVFRLVTVGRNRDVLVESIHAIQQAMATFPGMGRRYRIEVISERPLAIVEPRTHVTVVPAEYQTARASRFKARAISYQQSVQHPTHFEWMVYLDEESKINRQVVQGIFHFIATHPKRTIGQGAIVYAGGNWFFRAIDALRTADDLGRFRLQYALGRPFFGVHGSYIVVRGRDDTALSFDVGTANSITEDTAWALSAWARGYRFGWVAGYVSEQPPQRVMDLLKQRARWIRGIRLVLRDGTIPLRYRLTLGMFTALWQCSSLPVLIALWSLFGQVQPVLWVRLLADFALVTFFLAYVQGMLVEHAHQPQQASHRPVHAHIAPFWYWLPALGCSVFSVFEGLATVYSLLPSQGFHVIQKPRLVASC